MSKGLSAYHFDPINFQNAAFFYLDVVRLRATRHSKAEIVNFKKIKFSKPVDVLTTDLDAYLTDLGIIDKISFMKIDVDGPELLVLQSGRQLLKNQNLNILLEWDQDAAKWSNCSPESIIDILLEDGFEIYYPDYIKKKYFHITKERLLNIDPLDDVINILCVKDKSILEDNELLT